MMNISVIPYYQLLDPAMCRQQTVILLDIFRATSFMVTALARGCHSIVAVASADVATKVAAPDDWLAGESNGQQIPGFLLDNSPTALLNCELEGRRLVLTTTNGTQALQRTQQATQTVIGSFLNSQAVATYAYRQQRDILILCAGTRGAFSLEDSLAAGLIIQTIRSFDDTVNCDDLALLLCSMVQSSSSLAGACQMSVAAKRLQDRGKEADLRYCLERDTVSTVPMIEWRQIIVCSVKINICTIR